MMWKHRWIFWQITESLHCLTTDGNYPTSLPEISRRKMTHFLKALGHLNCAPPKKGPQCFFFPALKLTMLTLENKVPRLNATDVTVNFSQQDFFFHRKEITKYQLPFALFEQRTNPSFAVENVGRKGSRSYSHLTKRRGCHLAGRLKYLEGDVKHGILFV